MTIIDQWPDKEVQRERDRVTLCCRLIETILGGNGIPARVLSGDHRGNKIEFWVRLYGGRTAYDTNPMLDSIRAAIQANHVSVFPLYLGAMILTATWSAKGK